MGTAAQSKSKQIQDPPSGGSPWGSWTNLAPDLASGFEVATDWIAGANARCRRRADEVELSLQIKKSPEIIWFDYILTLPSEFRPDRLIFIQGFSGGNSAAGVYIVPDGHLYALQTYGAYIFLTGGYYRA